MLKQGMWTYLNLSGFFRGRIGEQASTSLVHWNIGSLSEVNFIKIVMALIEVKSIFVFYGSGIECLLFRDTLLRVAFASYFSSVFSTVGYNRPVRLSILFYAA